MERRKEGIIQILSQVQIPAVMQSKLLWALFISAAIAIALRQNWTRSAN